MSETDTMNGQAGLPMFYTQPEVLEASRHKGMGLRPHDGYAFAEEANAIPLNIVEFPRAGAWYPIVFAGKERLSPVAVVGLRRGANLFVTEGAWKTGAYVPAYLRRYPFILTKPDAEKDQVLLCVDVTSDRVAEGAEAAFFDGEDATEHTQNALKFCLDFQRNSVATELAMRALKEADVIVRQEGNIETADGEKLRLTDFHIVDEKKMNELSDEDFLKLRRTGALSVAYCQMMSMNNWPRLTQMMMEMDKAG